MSASLGTVSFTRRDGSTVEATLIQQESSPSEKEYTLLDEKLTLGRVYHRHVLSAEIDFWSCDSIHITTLIRVLANKTNSFGQKKIPAIGSYLLRCAFVDSLCKGGGGRLWMIAVNKSHFFYWSLGFRPVCRKGDLFAADLKKKMKEIYKKAAEKKEPALLGGGMPMAVSMFLPRKSIERWKIQLINDPTLIPFPLREPFCQRMTPDARL